MNKSGRFRPYEIVVYCTENELNGLLCKNHCRIAHYVYIKHDKDVYEEDNEELGHKKGELKKEHIHCLLDFFNPHTFTAVKKMFTTDVDKPRVEIISDRQAKYEYLTHTGYPNKYQYSKSLLISNDLGYYENICKQGDKRDTDNIAEQIIRDLLCNTSPYVMISRYGRDYIIHRQAYNDMADECRQYDFTHKKPKLYIDESEDIQEEIPFD